MPFTHVEIEERKSRDITLLFGMLWLLYVGSFFVLVDGMKYFLGFPGRWSMPQVLCVLGLAVAGTGVHWLASTNQLLDRVLAAVLARPIDSDDTYHTRLKDIVEEVAIATGGRYQITPYVIPTTAMNACAVADFNGRAAIAVTEGLLARLSRAQLESVVGHEAAHIASGDSLHRSIFCGLFGLHEEGLKQLSGMFSGDDGSRVLRGRAGGLVLFVMLVLWVTNKVKRLCELLISREQEYRADAVAVRLTRDPLSLAEALRLVSERWRGVGAQGESLSTIFFMDPGEESLSEQEGWAAELFSTHPPTERRIETLLGMAHMDPATFEQEVTRASVEAPKLLIEEQPPAVAPAKWWACLDGNWKGPLTLEEIGALDAVTPESWVRSDGETSAKPAYRDPRLLQLLQRRYGQRGPRESGTAGECPTCHVGLTQVLYEGVSLDACPSCRGCYVMPDQLTRIFARREYAFPESVKRLAKSIPPVHSQDRIAKKFNESSDNFLKDRSCPKCGSSVLRKFYTRAYLVEVEQCWMCGLTWLDPGELELLQCLYEDQEDRGDNEPEA